VPLLPCREGILRRASDHKGGEVVDEIDLGEALVSQSRRVEEIDDLAHTHRRSRLIIRRPLREDRAQCKLVGA